MIKSASKLASGRTSPQMTKTPQLSVQDSGSQTLTAYTSGSSVVSDDSTTGGASSDDVLVSNLHFNCLEKLMKEKHYLQL